MAKPQKIITSDNRTHWRIRYINADGKRESRTFATFDLARSELRRLEVGVEETKVRRKRYGSEETTVAKAWEVYKATRARDPNNTERRHVKLIQRAESNFTKHIGPHLGDKMLADLTPAELRKWIALLAAKPTARNGEKNATGRTLSAATIRSIVVTLRQIAKASDVPLAVVLGDSLRQKKRRSKPRALQTIGDVRRLLEACRDRQGGDTWFRIAAALACHLGARLGEVASLRWRDVGADVVTISLSWEGPLKARYEDDDEAARKLPLSADLAEMLAAWRKYTRGGPDDRIVVIGGELVDGRLVGARPLREGFDDVAAKTRSACKRAGLAPLTFHSLRASYATITASQGLPLKTMATLLGHADIETTAIYVRPEFESAWLDPRSVLGGRAVDADPTTN